MSLAAPVGLVRAHEPVLTSAAPSHEAQVVEPGHLVLHHGRGVPQLGRVVLVVAGHHGDQGPVGDVTKGHDLHRARGEGVGKKIYKRVALGQAAAASTQLRAKT